MKTIPNDPSATVAVRIKIAGQEFELTKAEAVKLLDSLQEAVGDNFPPPYVPCPYPLPVPVPYYERPYLERPYPIWVTTTGYPPQELVYPTRTICESNSQFNC